MQNVCPFDAEAKVAVEIISLFKHWLCTPWIITVGMHYVDYGV